MRIALTIDSFIEGQGGVSTAVAALARNLRQRGHQVVVYTAADPNHKQAGSDVVGLRALRYERFPGGRAPLAPISLVQELADFNPHVIHNHSMGTMGIQALAAARLLGVPILGTCHIFLAGFLQYAPISLEVVPLTIDMAWRYTTTFFNRFPQVTTPSNTMQRELIARGLRVPIVTVSNGVDTSLFHPQKDFRQHNTKYITLLHVGRLGYEKRVDHVLRAFAYLAPAHSYVRLLIVGDGPEANPLKTLATNLGVEDQVQFMGSVPHELLPEIYRKADLFITASTIETQGLVVLEAMACGLPIVGVAAMALPDLIEHGANGYLTKPGDEKDLAAITTQLIQSAELRYVMGNKSRNLALHHGLPEVAQTYERLYHQIIAQAPFPVFPQLPKTLNPDVVWAAFCAECQALKDNGVEGVGDVSTAVRQWTRKTFTPIVEQVRNELPGLRR